MPFAPSIAILTLVQASLIALPARTTLPIASRLANRWWALVLPGSIVVVIAGIAIEPGLAECLTYLALLAVPLLATLAASGWRDMTRLARGDVAVGAGIAATNGPEIAARIRDLIVVLESWSIALSAPDGPDESALADRLRVARERLMATDR